VYDLLAGAGVATGARAGGLEHAAPVALVAELDVVEVVARTDDEVDVVDVVVRADDEVDVVDVVARTDDEVDVVVSAEDEVKDKLGVAFDDEEVVLMVIESELEESLDDEVVLLVATPESVLEESLDEDVDVMLSEDVLPGALDVEVTEEEVKTELAELDVEVVLTTELLGLATMTGLRLLYIDNLLAPPHYLISHQNHEVVT
jgi:hypothetical protein